jgi:hypothetical protein
VPKRLCATSTNTACTRPAAACGRCASPRHTGRAGPPPLPGVRRAVGGSPSGAAPLGLDESDAHAGRLDGGELGLIGLAVGDELVDALDVADADEGHLADLGALGHDNHSLGVLE